MEYSRNYLVHYYELDGKRRLSLPSMIHYFEDIAILNSEAVGLKFDYYDKNERGWMLFKWDIKISRFPMFNEVVQVKTQPSSFKNFLANREYQILDLDGNLLATAQSVWIFVNTKTRKPFRVPEEMYSRFDVSKESEIHFDKLSDLQPIRNGNYSLRIKVHNSDIDTNQHVNNVRYVDWAMESLSKEFTDAHKVLRIEVNYKKELNFGDEAEIISSIEDESDKTVSYHTIINCDKDICNLKMEWEKEE